MGVGMVLMIMNQFSGGFLMTNYAAKIFKDVGSSLEPGICAIIIAVLQLVGTYVATILVDRVGRKILILVSMVSVSFGMLAMGIFSYLDKTGVDVSEYRLVPVFGLSFVVLIGCIGISTLPYVVLTELLPTKVRSVGMAICMASLAFIAFMVLKFFPILNEIIEFYGCMWLFATVCFLGSVFIYFLLPETKGKIWMTQRRRRKSYRHLEWKISN